MQANSLIKLPHPLGDLGIPYLETALRVPKAGKKPIFNLPEPVYNTLAEKFYKDYIGIGTRKKRLVRWYRRIMDGTESKCCANCFIFRRTSKDSCTHETTDASSMCDRCLAFGRLCVKLIPSGQDGQLEVYPLPLLQRTLIS